MPLSPALFKRVRQTLLRCPQFRSHTRLCALFNDTRIAVWRNEIQDHRDIAPVERVDLLVDVLLERQNTEGNQPLVCSSTCLEKHSHGAISCESN